MDGEDTRPRLSDSPRRHNFAQMIAARQVSGDETFALSRPRIAPILAELALIAVPALAIISVISAALASRQLFLGVFGDTEQFLWIVDNLKEAVASGDAVDTRAFFGVPTPLAYNPISLLTAIPTLVVYEITGNYFFAYNFVFLGFFLLNFGSMYAVLRLLGFDRSLSFAFGVVFLFAPNTMVHAIGHITLVVTFLIPLYLYVLYRLKLEPRRLIFWVALGVIGGAYIWAREELGLFIVLASVLFLTVVVQPFWKRGLNTQFLLYLVIVAVLAFPVVGLYLQRTSFDDSHGVQSVRSIEEAQLYSSSPANYLFPSDEGVVYQRLPRVFEQLNLGEHLNYLGIVNLGALIAWLYMLLIRRDLLDKFLQDSPFLRTMKGELLFIGFVSAVLSFGPVLELNDSNVKLPLYLGYNWDLPVVGQLRAWSRFGIFAFAAATFLSAYVFRFLLTRYSSRTAIPLIAALIVVVAVVDQYPIGSFNFPRHKTEVPSALSEIKADPGDFFVLDLPLVLYTGAQHNSAPLFFQLFHDKRIVNGYTAAYHPLVSEKVLNSPLICFNYPEMLDLAADAPECSESNISNFLADADIRYLIDHKQTPYYAYGYDQGVDAMVRAKYSAILKQLTASGALEIIYDDAGFTFYRRTQPSLAASDGR